MDEANLYAASEETKVHDNNPFTALREDLDEKEEEIRGEQGDDPQKRAKIFEKNAQS